MAYDAKISNDTGEHVTSLFNLDNIEVEIVSNDSMLLVHAWDNPNKAFPTILQRRYYQLLPTGWSVDIVEST